MAGTMNSSLKKRLSISDGSPLKSFFINFWHFVLNFGFVRVYVRLWPLVQVSFDPG
jgi:hypothetical protein